MFWKYILTITVTTGFNVQQMFPTAAAKAPSPLTCIVIQEADGLIYSLSRPPSSSNCETWWELENKTVVARNSKADFKLVQNLTDQFLTLNFCQSYLHYARSCSEGWEEAHCRVKCNLILDPNADPTTTVNSTLICITKTWCLTQLIFALGVIGIILLVVGVLVVLHPKCRRRICATMGASYIPANQQNNMEQEEMTEVNIKTYVGS